VTMFSAGSKHTVFVLDNIQPIIFGFEDPKTEYFQGSRRIPWKDGSVKHLSCKSKRTTILSTSGTILSWKDDPSKSTPVNVSHNFPSVPTAVSSTITKIAVKTIQGEAYVFDMSLKPPSSCQIKLSRTSNLELSPLHYVGTSRSIRFFVSKK
jgi:hypothetical protein